MAEPTCPPLGTGSIDFNAIHEAARKGRPLAEAIEKATTLAEPAAAPTPDNPAPPPAAEPAAG